MRLGPTFYRRAGPELQRKHRCSNCKAEFPVLQIIKINGKQLCIWCAGHPENPPSRGFTIRSTSSSARG